jgi:EmrB/QacA subfamily drug resistance transporter
MSGMAIFGLGSLLAAMSGGSAELIASRALMGVGAAAIMPTTLSILTNIFPEDERPKAIAIWAAASGMGIAIGPVSGGFLIEHFDWNMVFLVNLPVVALALLAGHILIPESKDPESPKVDVPGIGLSIAGLTAIVWALIEAPDRGWTSQTILAAFGAGLAIIGAFVAWELRAKQPMIDVSVFRNLRFSAASLAITFVFFALMGVMYFLTTYLQSVMGYTPLEAGIRTLPVAGGLLLAAKASVPLAKRFGTKVLVANGLATVAGALMLLAMADVDTGYWLVALSLAQMGAGMGLAMAPATEAIMGSLPQEKAGVGSAMNDVVREVGGTLGVAVLGSVLSSAYASGVDDSTTGLPAGAAHAASDSVGAAHDVAAQLGGGAGEKLIAASNQAFVDAMTTTATVAAAAALVGALIAAAFLPARARQETAPAGGEALAPAPA